MSLHVYTFCDICSQGQTVSQKVKSSDGRGWCDGSRRYAAEIGWAFKRGKDVCPECLYEQHPVAEVLD